VARDLAQLGATLGLNGTASVSPETAVAAAAALRGGSGASHAMAVLVALDDGDDGIQLGGTICVGIAGPGAGVSRQARMFGGRDWIRLGASELALDCLRRHLLGLPVDEQIDFERR
jgi:nicotinamide-nucleotide amidase